MWKQREDNEKSLQPIDELTKNLSNARLSPAGIYDNKMNKLTSRVEEEQKLQREAAKGLTSVSNENLEAVFPSAAATTGPIPESNENLEAAFPSAAASSKLQPSGMTFTQEKEEKAPIMWKQREEHEKSVQAIDELTKELVNVRREYEKLQVNFDDTTRRNFQLARENERLKRQTVDSGQQVRKQLEEAHGAQVSFSQNLASFRTLELRIKLENAVREIEEMKSAQERLMTQETQQDMTENLQSLGAVEQLNMGEPVNGVNTNVPSAMPIRPEWSCYHLGMSVECQDAALSAKESPTQIGEMAHETLKTLGLLLSAKNEKGKDWRHVAVCLGYSGQQIISWEQQSAQHPAQLMLLDWQYHPEHMEPTVRNLKKILWDLELNDIARFLERECN